MGQISRRAAIRVLATPALGQIARAQSVSKKVIVAGAGIAGLCCAYELMKRGFEVIVLEASGRTGGHILTLHDKLPEGLYADAGAEHFYRPGYDQLWSYLDEFKLPIIAYPRRKGMLRSMGNRLCTPEEVERPAMLTKLGYNQPEIDYIRKHSLGDLPGLYFAKYAERFADEYKPFEAKLDHLDSQTTSEFLLAQGASAAAAQSLGGDGSALQTVWHAVIRMKRHMNWLELNLFRIQGGNQRLIDAFAIRLRERIWLGCPVTGIEYSGNAVRVEYRDGARMKREEADHLVTCMPLATLRQIPVKPDWPEAKRYVIQNMPHSSHCRVVIQSRTRFWKKDGLSPNMSLEDAGLGMVWAMAEEVQTARGLLIGTAGVTTGAKAAAAYRRLYPGKSEDIEDCFTVDWTTDRWAMSCLPNPLPPGVLAKYWPQVLEPVGRIHFAGVYADNYPFGMEGAVRSAHRAVREIESA
jgi:monoamine oxidase